MYPCYFALEKMYKTCHIYAVFFVLTLFTLAAASVCADVVVLQNGESLSGTFSRIRENTLIFRTSMQGQLMTPMSEVRALSTDKTLCITLTDGQVLYGRLAIVDEVQQLFPLNGEAPIQLAAAAIQETLPIPTPPAAAGNTGLEGLNISGSAGVQWRSGSTTAVEPTIRLDAQGGSETWRFDAGTTTERAEPENFPAYLRAQAELFGNRTGKTSPYMGMETERDLDRALELRQHLALGLYQSLYGTNTAALGALAGIDLGYEQEESRQQAISRTGFALNLRLGLRYYQLFARQHSLSTALMLLPSLTEHGGFRARSETAYSLPMADRLQLRLELIIGYDNDPLTSDIDRWSATIGAGLNLAF